MKRRFRTCVAVCVSAGCLALLVRGAAAGDDAASVAALWKQMCTADVDSAEFKAAQWKLTATLGTMPASKRTAVATAMMDPSAEGGVNSAALELFGQDALPITDVQRVLWDAQRSDEQRELLKTYYSFCRADAKASLLSEATRRQLVAVLSERLENLAGTDVHYGEQRLFTHLCAAALSRYCRAPGDVPEARSLLKALGKYGEKAGKSDGFGAVIPAWLDMIQSGEAKIDTFGKAVQALAHWEPVVRLKAAAYLGELVPTDDKAAEVVLSLLGDGRDEVRAAAVRVFAFAKDYRPDVVVPQLVLALTQDRGVIVQEAASEALAARADQAQGQVAPLLRVLTSPARWLGKKRTSHILAVLSKLVKGASPEQRSQLLELAQMRLADSPDGALAALQALGPEAAKAVPAIRDYRGAADRFRRAYIDRHVLPAILPDEAPEKGG